MRFQHTAASTITAAISTALLLAGCSAPATPIAGGDAQEVAGGDAQEACDISFLSFQSPALSNEFWEGQVAAIEEIYPNMNVELQYTPGLDRKAYASQLLAAGNLPDVIWDVSGPEFVQAGALLPYDEADIAKLGVSMEVGIIDGKHYSLSVGSQPKPMIFYNADEFDALGISVPTTYAEFKVVAEKIADAGKTPLLVGGGADPWTSTMLLGGIINTDVYAENPNWLQERKQGTVKFTDKLFADAVSKWADLVEGGLINDDALGLDYSQLVSKFLNGEGVMYPMGAWAAATEADFNIGVFALPTEDGQQAILGDEPTQRLYVSSQTECPAVAKAFAVSLATSAEFATAFLLADSLIPSLPGYELPADTSPLGVATAKIFNDESVTFVAPWGWEDGASAPPLGFVNEFNKGAQEIISGGGVGEFLAEMDRVFDDLNAG